MFPNRAFGHLSTWRTVYAAVVNAKIGIFDRGLIAPCGYLVDDVDVGRMGCR